MSWWSPGESIEVLLARVVSVFVGLRDPLRVFPLTRGREDPVCALLNNFWRTSTLIEGCERLLIFAEAHSEDRGRKIAHNVKTLDDMAGLSTTYCRTEKMADVNVSLVKYDSELRITHQE